MNRIKEIKKIDDYLFEITFTEDKEKLIVDKGTLAALPIALATAYDVLRKMKEEREDK